MAKQVRHHDECTNRAHDVACRTCAAIHTKHSIHAHRHALERESYGSLLPELLDSPLNEITLLRCNAAVIIALAKWEPRFVISQASTQAVMENGQMRVRISLSGDLGGKATEFLVSI